MTDVLRYRRPLSKRILNLLLLVIGAWSIFSVLLAAFIHLFGQNSTSTEADVIIVLGPALRRRCNHAADLWSQGLAPTVMYTGGVEEAGARSQAQMCRQMLMARGVPAEAIVLEEQSLSTEQNALHSRAVMDAQGWQTAIIVSDSFHMLRAQWLFQQQGIDVYRNPVPERRLGLTRYLAAIGREVVALYWQVFKQVFHLPYTHVPGL